jgi:hypothetical protein
MKRLLLSALVAVIPFAVAVADSKSEIAAGVKELGAQSGYAWTYTPKTLGSESAKRQQSPLDGKTERDGYTLIHGEIGDVSVDIGLKGDKLVVNYSGDWLSAAEIGENNRTVQRLRTLKRPTDEAQLLLEKTVSIKKDADGSYTGELDATWAKEIFALLGRRAAEAPTASGSVKFWIKAGQLDKYEFIVRGKITTGTNKEEAEVSRTTTVEIKDVGTTKVSLPDEAKKKLS